MASAIEDVTQLVLRERQTRDHGWWDEMAACYAADSIVDISWFTGSGADFVRRTVEMSKDGVWGRHRLSPPTIRVDGNRAWAELPIAIEFRIDVDGVEADLISYARTQYRCRQDDGLWKIVHFTSIYERDTLAPSLPGGHLAVRPEEFTGRAAYRCLAWYLERGGAKVSQDLLGEDRPDAVARQYEAERRWLTSGKS